jgi:hypothetical protein
MAKAKYYFADSFFALIVSPFFTLRYFVFIVKGLKAFPSPS